MTVNCPDCGASDGTTTATCNTCQERSAQEIHLAHRANGLVDLARWCPVCTRPRNIDTRPRPSNVYRAEPFSDAEFLRTAPTLRAPTARRGRAR